MRLRTALKRGLIYSWIFSRLEVLPALGDPGSTYFFLHASCVRPESSVAVIRWLLCSCRIVFAGGVRSSNRIRLPQLGRTQIRPSPPRLPTFHLIRYVT